ncbi:hypothetical protein AWENTII_012485 [Aspergillus wentii]
MQWGGWIVLAATIILVSCGVVTCAMRRTLVSRKARKKRIAENAEMSGENYYNRQNAAAAALDDPKPVPLNGDTKEPVVSGSPTFESGPTFATFRTTTRESDDDRTPLNSHTPLNEVPMPESQYPAPYSAARDEAGNPLPPSGPYAPAPRMRTNPSDPRLRNQYSDGSMGSRRGAPPPGFGPRGRGGYPPRGGYGRGGPYGGPRGPPPNGRGGPMGPMRGGPPGMMGRGQRGPPAPYGPGPAAQSHGFDFYGAGPGLAPRPTPPPADDGYEQRGPSPVGLRQPSPGPIGMAVSPDAPIGQAIEMTPQIRRAGSVEPESHNMLGVQPHALSADGYSEPVSPSSLYSRTPSYIPARAGWNDTPHTAPSPSPVHAYGSPAMDRKPHHTRSGSDNYYEDVDPRFADEMHDRVPSPRLPSALMPGPIGEPKPKDSVDDVPEGPSSPTSSEISHFTSISERPINPRWRPPPPRPNMGQLRTNVLLENNPDFDLQAGRGRGGAGTGIGGRMPPMAVPREPSRYPIP